MPSDAAFRDALEEYRLAFTADKHEPNNGPVPHCAGCDEVRRTRARVLALYAEVAAERDDLMAIAIGDKVRKPSNPSLAERQGEEYGVRRIWVTSRADRMEQQDVVFLNGVKPGDRVWVTKVEEGQ